MSERMNPIPFDKLLDRVLTEYAQEGTVFGGAGAHSEYDEDEGTVFEAKKISPEDEEGTVFVSRQLSGLKTCSIKRISTGQVIPIKKATATIGRRSKLNPTPDVDLYDNKAISRRHAEILQKAGKFWIRDNESAGGVAVDGDLARRILV